MAPPTVDIIIQENVGGSVVFGFTSDKKQNTNLSCRVTVSMPDGTEQVSESENLYKWNEQDDGLWHSHVNAVNCPAGSKANVLLYHANQNVAEQDFEF